MDSRMFSFLMDTDNYEDRKIANFTSDECKVDTCAVSDGKLPYETGVAHMDYNHGSWIIVEAYDTRLQAKKGHDKWVKIMTTEPLPNSLIDCKNAQMAELFGDRVLEYYRER